MELRRYIFSGADIWEKLFYYNHSLSFLTYFYKIAVLSKRYKPDNFESQNSLKLIFTSIRGLCSNFAEFQSFLEANS